MHAAVVRTTISSTMVRLRNRQLAIQKMSTDPAYHYPPDLLNLLVDAVALLVRSKEAVVDFFRSAGVPSSVLCPWLERVRQDRENIRKTEITRAVLCHVNEMGDNGLALRREIIKRVVEWEDFSSCYPDKQLAAQVLSRTFAGW